MRRDFARGVGTVVLLLAFGCAHSNQTASGTSAAKPLDEFTTQTSCHPPTWSYPSNNAAWGGTCYTGQSQSPVVLPYYVAPPPASSLPGTVTVTSAPIPRPTLINEGYTVSVPIPPGTISFADGAKTWTAFEVHFHTPSEHSLAIGGGMLPTTLEMHIKTELKSDPKQNAVFAVLFQYGLNGADIENIYLQPIFSQLNALASKPVCATLPSNAPFDLTPLIQWFGESRSAYFTYSGSLTTPGCDEAKMWYVLNGPQLVSQQQVSMLERFIKRGMGSLSPYGTNNRRVQLLNSRTPQLYVNK